MTARATPEATARLHRPVGGDDHLAGRPDAPVTLVEYGDYECPYCRRAHPIVQELRRRFGDSLRFAFRNFPLAQVHPHAMHAAEAAESVGAHAGEAAFWAMHDLIFLHQRDAADALDDAHLARYAAEAGGDPARVLADLAAGTFAARVREQFRDGIRSGVNGTPTFFIDGVRWDGPWSVPEELAAALEAAGARRA